MPNPSSEYYLAWPLTLNLWPPGLLEPLRPTPLIGCSAPFVSRGPHLPGFGHFSLHTPPPFIHSVTKPSLHHAAVLSFYTIMQSNQLFFVCHLLTHFKPILSYWMPEECMNPLPVKRVLAAWVLTPHPSQQVAQGVAECVGGLALSPPVRSPLAAGNCGPCQASGPSPMLCCLGGSVKFSRQKHHHTKEVEVY